MEIAHFEFVPKGDICLQYLESLLLSYCSRMGLLGGQPTKAFPQWAK